MTKHADDSIRAAKRKFLRTWYAALLHFVIGEPKVKDSKHERPEDLDSSDTPWLRSTPRAALSFIGL